MNASNSSPGSIEASWLRRHRNFITGLLLMLTAWAIYLPTLGYGFVDYDDARILRSHPELYGQKSLSAGLRAVFVTCLPREEPLFLRDVSWMLDSRIYGFGNAFGYHLGNVLLHGIVGALLFAFLLGTTRRYGFALAVTIAWLVLAIHTEPVAWIMGRKDILSTLFMLLGLGAQTRRLTSPSARARCGWYLVTLAAFGCGLLSKISVLSFPLVLLLHAVFLPYLNGERPPAGNFSWGRPLAREILFAVPAFLISGFAYGWYSRLIGLDDAHAPAHGTAHLWNLLMLDPLAVGVYWQQTFFPWHLGVLYVWPQILPAYPHWQIAASLTLATVLGGAGFWLLRRRKDLFFYFAAFFAIMIPYLNLVMPGILVAERYLYFAGFCLLALAVSTISFVLRQSSPVLRVCALAVGIGLAAWNLFQTFSYQTAWRSGETLWQYHLALPRPSPAAYANLAASYYAQATDQVGTPAMAVTMKKVAVVVDAGLAQFWPDHRQPPPPETYFLFFLQSLVQEVRGEPDAALASLLISDRLRPGFDSTNRNLALLYHKLAGTAVDASQRKTYARAARERYAEYLALAYRGRPAPPEAQALMKELDAGCAAAD